MPGESKYLVVNDNDNLEFTETVPVVGNNISASINKTISIRNGRLTAIDAAEKRLTSMIEQLDVFMEKKKKFLSDCNTGGNPLKELNNLDAAEAMKNIESITDIEINDIIQKAKDAVTRLQEASVRFSADNIRIGIVGGARNGKSTLIQKITGLDDDIVPTSSSYFCTGTRSVIQNDTDFFVDIEFYTEKELLDEVISKYKELYAEYGTSSQRLDALSDISDLYNSLKNRQIGNNVQYISGLRRYHDCIDDYKGYLGKSAIRLDISQKDEIRRYVSQIGTDGITRYNRFLSVKKVTIHCPFVVNDIDFTQLVLIDTIGIGETTLGVQDQMLDTISKESDFVLILNRMSKDSAQMLMEKDIQLYLKTVSVKKSLPSNWLYWVLNRNSNDYDFDNDSFDQWYFPAILNWLETNKDLYPGAVLNIDCADYQEIKNGMINPMLHHISTHLDKIDSEIVDSLNNAVKEVNLKFNELLNKLKTISISSNDRHNFIITHFNTAHENLVTKMIEYDEQYKMQKSQQIPSINLDVVARLLRSKAVPSTKVIKNKWETTNSYLLAANYAFEETRTNVSKIIKSKNINAQIILRQFKKDIAIAILNATGLKDCIVINLDDEQVLRSIADKLFSNSHLCANLYAEFISLSDFDIKDATDIEKLMYEPMQRYLDINENPDVTSGLFPAVWSKKNNIGVIELWNALQNHIIEMTNSFIFGDNEELSERPLKLLVNRLSMFKTAIINNNNKEGWRYVYETHAANIWREELKKLESDAIQIKSWNDLITGIVEISDSQIINIH